MTSHLLVEDQYEDELNLWAKVKAACTLHATNFSQIWYKMATKEEYKGYVENGERFQKTLAFIAQFDPALVSRMNHHFQTALQFNENIHPLVKHNIFNVNTRFPVNIENCALLSALAHKNYELAGEIYDSIDPDQQPHTDLGALKSLVARYFHLKETPGGGLVHVTKDIKQQQKDVQAFLRGWQN